MDIWDIAKFGETLILGHLSGKDKFFNWIEVVYGNVVMLGLMVLNVLPRGSKGLLFMSISTWSIKANENKRKRKEILLPYLFVCSNSNKFRDVRFLQTPEKLALYSSSPTLGSKLNPKFFNSYENSKFQACVFHFTFHLCIVYLR